MAIATAARQDVVKLRTLLQDKPWNMPLKRGEIESGIVQFDFDDVAEASDHFKPLVRELAYDCGELAIVTYLQARTYNKALVLLPFVVTGNFHHNSIAYNAEKGDLAPVDLAGRRVGVRTYSQTTGVWVRGILQNEYGVELDKVTWITFDDSHLAEYNDPPNCQRAPRGRSWWICFSVARSTRLFRQQHAQDPRLKTLFRMPTRPHRPGGGMSHPDQSHVCREAVAVPGATRCRAEIYRMLLAGRAAGLQPAAGSLNMAPSGVEAVEGHELVIDYAFQQKVIPEVHRGRAVRRHNAGSRTVSGSDLAGRGHD
jgi:4,5-dihydroxyphthalate decarboxylase